MKRPIFLISFIFTIIIVLAIVQVSVMNQITTTGMELAKTENELNTYTKENTILEEQVLQASSLTSISAKAKKLGFVDTTADVYFSTPLPLALNQ